MEDEAPIARYDAEAGTLRVVLTGGEELTIAGVGNDLPLRRAGPEPIGALWLSATQADVLIKLVSYVLRQVKISAESRATLDELLPFISQLKDELSPPDEGDEGPPE